MHFIHKIQCFKEFLHKTSLFSKNLFFLFFFKILINRTCFSINRNFGQPLSVSIDARLILGQSKHFRSIEPNFRSIENHMESFLKHLILTCSNTFSKSFQTSLSLSDRPGLQSRFFVIFLCSFCKVFLL